MALKFTDPQKPIHGLLGIEKATLVYTLFTTLLIFILWGQMTDPIPLVHGRVFILMGMAVTFAFYHLRPCQATVLLRYVFPFSLLAYWYPDTYEFCQLFPNLDHLFAAADLWLFGCQPSLTFSELMPSKLWSELFHMGYFAYYPMIAVCVVLPLFMCPRRFSRTAFVVLASFFLYYTIYLFLPVTGPQFYFHAIGTEAAQSGALAHLGDYFRTHTEMLSPSCPNGLFRTLVEQAQASGERPTAAFPSSHVGISTVLMMLSWGNCRKSFWALLPFYLLLCCATVYISAHYFVDVVGGLVSAVAFFYFTRWLFTKVERREWSECLVMN